MLVSKINMNLRLPEVRLLTTSSFHGEGAGVGGELSDLWGIGSMVKVESCWDTFTAM